MSLPTEFLSAHDYFRASVNFLQTHSWIYHSANTRFIKAGVFEKFPPDFVEYFLKLKNSDLNKFPFLHECDDFNNGIDSPALQSFRSTLRKLIPKQAYDYTDHSDLTPRQVLLKSQLRKIRVKKQHEIIQLTKVILTHCCDASLLLDFGAGLGYLSESLCSVNTSWCVLGLESDNCRVTAARKRLQQQMPEASRRVIYVQQLIEANSSSAIKQHIACSRFDDSQAMLGKWAIIGLHACADLSVTAINLFLELAEVKCLVIMPCCYHKLQQTTDGNFLNFPLSKSLKKIVAEKKEDIESYLNRPFLRLACQETSARWRNSSGDEHLAHGKQMFWRAVADAIIDDETETIRTLVKSQRPAADIYKTESFANFCQHYELRSKATDVQHLPGALWNDKHEEKFNEIVEKYSDTGPKLAEALTCLQTTLQKLCENIVLYDRLCYMQEYAEERPNLKLNVQIQKILDEKLSPRCYALIAEKL
ncbi:probable methyltransferase-like protein 25 isoform X2 [Anastrepha obliqua]|nr:probable methyltransferase-like protein 25 isoform X2 [Anastrepha obliqua]XP_054737060.1 probable methyltransferase-like protein 25 isoform X2 [Anastrepha obliqua]